MQKAIHEWQHWWSRKWTKLTKVGVHSSSTVFSSLSKTYNDNAMAAAANLEGSLKFNCKKLSENAQSSWAWSSERSLKGSKMV